jgi:hypothetical protein
MNKNKKIILATILIFAFFISFLSVSEIVNASEFKRDRETPTTTVMNNVTVNRINYLNLDIEEYLISTSTLTRSNTDSKTSLNSTLCYNENSPMCNISHNTGNAEYTFGEYRSYLTNLNILPITTDYFSFNGNFYTKWDFSGGLIITNTDEINYNPNKKGFNYIESINPTCDKISTTIKGLDDSEEITIYVYVQSQDYNTAEALINSNQNIIGNGQSQVITEEYSEEIYNLLNTNQELQMFISIESKTINNNNSLGHYAININCNHYDIASSNNSKSNIKMLDKEEFKKLLDKYENTKKKIEKK